MLLSIALIFFVYFSVQPIVVQGAAVSCNCVAFRLDDIQDYWITTAQQTVISMFNSYGYPLTIGIIANYFQYDVDMVSFVQNQLTDSNFCLEVADHGYNHEDFTTFSLQDQNTLLQEAVALIKATTGITTTTFIPPFNYFNPNTITALINQSFTHMSAQTSDDFPPFPNNPITDTFFRFPIGAATSNLNVEGGQQVGVTAETTYQQILTQIATDGFSVVMMHPQDFSNYVSGDYVNELNYTQLNELTKLLIMMQTSGISLTTIGQIEQLFPGGNPNPDCVWNAPQNSTHTTSSLQQTTQSVTTGQKTTKQQTTKQQTTKQQTTKQQTTQMQTTQFLTTNQQTTGLQTTQFLTTNQQTTGLQTTQFLTTNQQTTGQQTTIQVTTGLKTTNQVTTGLKTTGFQTTNQVTTGTKTTESTQITEQDVNNLTSQPPQNPQVSSSYKITIPFLNIFYFFCIHRFLLG